MADDPLLTSRPVEGSAAGPRQPLRIVLDGQAQLPLTSKLVQTARQLPVLVAVGPQAPGDRLVTLEAAGCEIWQGDGADHAARTAALLTELGRRRLTNLLVEGGPTLLAGMFAADQIDEAWVFVAPLILGGGSAGGSPSLPDVPRLAVEDVSFPGGDVLIRGTIGAPRITSPACLGSRFASG